MNTLNAATIARIAFVADCAHEDCHLTTLKNAKDGIENRSKIFAGYEATFAGVDMVLLKSIFAPALAVRTKKEFITFIEAVAAAMVDARIELEKAEEAAKIAAAHPRTVEAAPVAAEPTAAEVMQITFYGANDYAARRAIVEAAHAEALELNRIADMMRGSPYIDPARRDAPTATAPAEIAAPVAPVPAADISAIDIKELHIPIDEEQALPYAQKVVTRAYVARSIARALASHTRHAEKYTAQDRLWLAEHNADHAHRNGVITSEEFAALYNMLRAPGADCLELIDKLRLALLAGQPALNGMQLA